MSMAESRWVTCCINSTRALGGICGLQRGELMGGSSAAHNDELGEHYCGVAEIVGGVTVCVGNLRECRYKHRRQDDIKVDIGETRWQVLGRINLPQYRNQWLAVVNTAMNFRVS
jgi:hypothetical protein